jgi:hypothetical protein
MTSATANLRVCFGCREASDEKQLSFCPDCDSYICRYCDCTYPVETEEAVSQI